MPDADLLRQPHRQPPGGQQPDPGVGVGEPGLLGGDQDVAVQRQLEPAGDGRAVDGADHRLGHRRPLRRDVGQLGGVAQFLEVEARAEHRVGAGEDDDVDGVVGLGIAQRGEELGAQRRRQRVAGLRPVQRQGADPVGGVDQQHDRRSVIGLNLSWTYVPKHHRAPRSGTGGDRRGDRGRRAPVHPQGQRRHPADGGQRRGLRDRRRRGHRDHHPAAGRLPPRGSRRRPYRRCGGPRSGPDRGRSRDAGSTA